MEQTSFIPSTLKILGLDDNDLAIIWSTDYRRLFRCRIRDLSMTDLVTMGGRAPLADVIDKVTTAYGNKVKPLGYIKLDIAEAVRFKSFSNEDSIGQGVWAIDGDAKVLIVNGTQAEWYDGNNFQSINMPVVGEHLLQLGRKPWVNMAALRQTVNELSPESMKATWEELLGILHHWNLAREDLYPVLAGMIVATSIQGYLNFRPQVWVTGATNAGKTVLKDMLLSLWPYAVSREAETSAAGLRQSVGNNSKPVFLDEQEAWHGRDQLVKMGRVSSRGGIISKGTPSGNAVDYRLSLIMWLFSIEADLPGAADKNRWVLLDLLPVQPKFIPPKILDPQELGVRILACAIKCASAIRQNAYDLGYAAMEQYGRLAEVFSTSMAVRAVLTGEDSTSMLTDILVSYSAGITTTSDEQQLIDDIVNSKLPSNNSRAIELLYKTVTRPKVNEGGKPFDWELMNAYYESVRVLGMSGIRHIKSDGQRMVFFACNLVRESLLIGTRWHKSNIEQILKRIPGAIKTKQQLYPKGPNVHGWAIPTEKCYPVDADLTAKEPADRAERKLSKEDIARKLLADEKREPGPYDHLPTIRTGYCGLTQQWIRDSISLPPQKGDEDLYVLMERLKMQDQQMLDKEFERFKVDLKDGKYDEPEE
jgi:hypothetical protein